VVAENRDVEKKQVTGNKKHRLTAFAFRGSETGIDIKIIGCLKVTPAPSQPVYSKGIVVINNKAFSVFDLQTLAGLRPKTISDKSCIVLLDPDEHFMNFSRAIIVDDVSEMLRIAEKHMEGLPVDSLFGCKWHCLPEKPAPDFPDMQNENMQFNQSHNLRQTEHTEKKYVLSEI
jgi:chemotaxis signal transduction protein